MAKKIITSLKKRKAPKKPKLSASRKTIEAYAKKSKEVEAHNKSVDAEVASRKKLLGMR